MVRPWKLVVPVPDKVQNPISKSRHTLIVRQRRRTQQTLQESRKQPKDNKLRPAQPIVTVAELHRSEHEMRHFFIF